MQQFKSDATGWVRYHDLPGDDTPIVFLHGLGCSGSHDYPMVASDPRLASHRRILVDLPGSGYSDKPDDFGYSVPEHAGVVVSLLDHLGLDEGRPRRPRTTRGEGRHRARSGPPHGRRGRHRHGGCHRGGALR